MVDPADIATTIEKHLNRQTEIERRLDEINIVDTLTSPAMTTTTTTMMMTTTVPSTVPSRGTRRTIHANAKPMETTSADVVTPKISTLIPYTPKTTDTHWDFVMKEMMWLGADFQGERKRQMSSAKKLASRYVERIWCNDSTVGNDSKISTLFGVCLFCFVSFSFQCCCRGLYL